MTTLLITYLVSVVICFCIIINCKSDNFWWPFFITICPVINTAFLVAVLWLVVNFYRNGR